jgi:broad specificity phosphatase PhoE
MASYFITHPEVSVHPMIPIEQWGLSPVGLDRARLIQQSCWDDGVVQIASSTEQKAVEAADILASAVAKPVHLVAALRENDRSSTGYLPLEEFEAVADEFFAHPHVRVRGWETAADAQRRIVRAVKSLTTDPLTHTAIVAHGAVGTLLYCDLTQQRISRVFDQPGQGSWFEFDPETWTALHGWRRIGEEQ